MDYYIDRQMPLNVTGRGRCGRAPTEEEEAPTQPEGEPHVAEPHPAHAPAPKAPAKRSAKAAATRTVDEAISSQPATPRTEAGTPKKRAKGLSEMVTRLTQP